MKKVGKYVVCGLLGKGGTSAVYKARLPFLNKIVALKLLCPHPNLISLAGSEALRAGFISEAVAIASLRHPNIVEILDFDFHGDRPFFTMEYYYHDLGRLMGETYRVNLPCRILSLDKTIHYCRQLLAGLARLHRANLTHRDIKPANLIIADDDRLKICDFGFSRLRGERPTTPSNLIIGSPFYAAPEQERDPDAVDHRADLYSAGVVVHRMLTGFLPDEGIRNPEDYHPEADSSWGAFVRKALENDPDRRFATPDEMLAGLEELSAAWEKKKQDTCRFASGVLSAPRLETLDPKPSRWSRKKLRSVALKVRSKEASAIFGCDRLMRPLAYNDDITSLSVRRDVVYDSAGGLVWQRSGSEDPLDRAGAEAYAESLNVTGFAGVRGWRLPTVDELLSLLGRPGFGIWDCFLPAFDTRRKSLWSCDRCTFVSGWYVNMELGFAGFADFTCHFHVRAVAGVKPLPESAMQAS
jgi:serine/threonine-protein kinase